MSGTGNQKLPAEHQEYYPPPPPGPPPAHANPLGSNPHQTYGPQETVPQQPYHQQTAHQQPIPQQSIPHHSNETPIPDHAVPTYNPSNTQHQPLAQQHSYLPPLDGGYSADHPTTTHQQADSTAAKSSWGQRFSALAPKVAAPFNALANKMGSEAFLPTTMDKECEKAARILRSFCKDGIYSDSAPPSQSTTAPPTTGAAPSAADSKPGHGGSTTQAAADPSKPKKPRVLLTIPSKVIARAQGLAIFTTVRAGFHVSGASGSGILIARLPDGSWSPPSGIQVHSVGAGFVVGLDIYDCVVVINTREALEAFTRTRMSLGSDLAVTAGPWGAGGMVDFGVPQGEGKGKDKDREGRNEKEHLEKETDHVYPQGVTGTGTGTGAAPLATPATGTSKDRKPSPFREAIKKPVYSYVKSRGFYAGVQVDGTVITERKDANAAFYGDKGVTVERILKGDVRHQTGEYVWPAAARGLVEVLAGAEGWRGKQGEKAAGGVSTGASGAHHQAEGGSWGGGVPPSGATGVAGVTEGVRHVDLNAAPQQQQQQHLASAQQSYGQSAKAAEAAAEARANEPRAAGPPSYYEPEAHHGGHAGHGEELPPA